MARKVWLITGISRGLGRALAGAVLARGDAVVGTTRSGSADLPAHEQLTVLPLDVTDRAAVFAQVAAAHAVHGRLDVVLNNAGYGLLGPVESSSDREVRDVMAANFFGPLHVVQAALPLLRRQSHGRVINITSIAGLAPSPGSGLYAAAKFAVEGFSASLAQEVAPLGIRVTCVEPGALRTEFVSRDSIRHTAESPDA
jgi:NAD(P)-dependent dehydrogenase (short-subunit alcohol dehydrogenase family)